MYGKILIWRRTDENIIIKIHIQSFEDFLHHIKQYAFKKLDDNNQFTFGG